MVAHEQMERNGLDLEQAMQRPMEMAKEYPVASMLVLFGVGLGVGILIGQSAPSMPSSNSWSDRLSDTARGWTDAASNAASRSYDSASRYMDSSYVEKLGSQLCDAIASAIPSSFAKQFRS